jgi:hypothetical protein
MFASTTVPYQGLIISIRCLKVGVAPDILVGVAGFKMAPYNQPHQAIHLLFFLAIKRNKFTIVSLQ